jgi:phage-related protein (TIGR01555 family)
MGWGGARPGPANAGGRKPATNGAAKPKLLPAAPRSPLTIDHMRQIIQASRQSQPERRAPLQSPFKLPSFPPNMLPPKNVQMAMDEQLTWADTQWAAAYAAGSYAAEGLLFPGYPLLAELAQRPEYRVISETIADDATRRWIDFEVTGNEDENRRRAEADPEGEAERMADPDERKKRVRQAGKTDKVKALKDDQARLEVRDRFYEISRIDGFFGRSHLFMDFGTPIDARSAELKTPIGDGRDVVSRAKVGKGTLRRLKVIEPVWAYPTSYNATNPLLEEWYNPQVWFVMGTEVHASRMPAFVGHPVPDMLKPAYSFGGLSLSQMAVPYVDIWLQTRESVAALIKAFSVMVLETDLATMVQPDNAEGLMTRIAMFNALRDNQGTFVVNKATEGFQNVAAPLSGLHELQAQAQEHMASVSRIPLVKLLGIQPAGLNASSEGEINVYDDTIAAYQNRFYGPRLTTLINFEQLSLWGEIDPEITHVFEPLRVLTEKERGDKEKAEAERDKIYIDAGVLAPEEVRARVIDDPDLPYAGLDPEDVPDLQQEEEQGLQPPGGGGNVPGESAGEERGGEDHALLPFARDDWHESDHPRGQPGNAGQFGSGGGGKAPAKQIAHAPQYGLLHGRLTATSSPPPAPKYSSNVGAPIDVGSLKKVGGQKGSNPGGVYEDGEGTRFYVKKGKSKDHVRNEMIAAALYNLAGSPTLRYRPVEGGGHVATEMADLDKDNASKLSPEERDEAAQDLAVHAWLGNWDAVGTGGDNVGAVKGRPVSLDLGGALEYRAQGAPKGKAFGASVGELDTLRDPKSNPDAAKVFGAMTPSDMRESARYVTAIPDSRIKATVAKLGGAPELADKLIARKQDIAARMRMFGDDGDPAKKTAAMVVPAGAPLPVKELNGVKFAPWQPPENWADVEGQDHAIEEPEFVVPKGKTPSSGVVIREPDGRVWLVQPRGAFGGYDGTFPKGGVEEGLSLQANAIKEAYEESGLKVRIVKHLADRSGDATMTRYYLAEREGGDPSQHDDESEGVVLAPVGKAAGFLNRQRDREIIGLGGDALFDDPDLDTENWVESTRRRPPQSINVTLTEQQLAPRRPIDEEDDAAGAGEVGEDEANFQESKHPRDSGGKFAETAGGGSPENDDPAPGSEEDDDEMKGASSPPAAAPKKTAFGGLWKVGVGAPGSKEEFGFNLNHVLGKATNAGSTYRTMLGHFIKNAAKHGYGDKVPALKAKLGEAFKLAGEKAEKLAAENAANPEGLKFQAMANKAYQQASSYGVVKQVPVAGAKPAEPKKPDLAKAIAEQAIKDHPGMAAALKQKATPAELEKAKKSIALQPQYVPGYGDLQFTPTKTQADGLVAEFNKEWAGKDGLKPEQLEQKVQAFKVLGAKVATLKAAEAVNAQQLKAKEQAAQAEKNKKAADALKEQQAAAKAKNKQYMDALGISETEATGFDALVEMMSESSSKADLIEKFKSYESAAAKLGYPISGFQYALIRNYINGGYKSINKALRSNSWSTPQHVYARLVNNAIDKIPKYTGTVVRGTTLDASEIAAYKPGHVVVEKGFTSTGVGYKFGGNVHYTIKATGKRGGDFSTGANTGEKEVLFKAHTFFLVHKVEKKGNVTHIHMEEVEGHG